MPTERMSAKEFRASGLQIRNTSKGRTDYKADLVRQMREAELPEPVEEFVFHEARKWRFDWLFKDYSVAVEYEGGVFDETSGHKSTSGILRDIEKYNEATLAGYRVIRVTAQTVASGVAIRYIIRAIKKASCDNMPGEKGKLAHVKRKLEGLIDSIDKL